MSIMARMIASSFTTRLLSTVVAFSKPSSFVWCPFGGIHNRADYSSSSNPLLHWPHPTFHQSSEIPGLDFNHWVIGMYMPGGEGASKQQMIDYYIQTLAKVLGSEEEAKKRIYNVYFGGWDNSGFGCEIDEETCNKLKLMPGVIFSMPDSYVDPENKDYGDELLVNGEIVQRPPRM